MPLKKTKNNFFETICSRHIFPFNIVLAWNILAMNQADKTSKSLNEKNTGQITVILVSVIILPLLLLQIKQCNV
jgi:hypothetical protein